MTKNKYVRLVNDKKEEKTSFQVFKDFVETRTKYKNNFWIILTNWMNNLSTEDKKTLKKEIEDKKFKSSTDIWTFLGF